MKIIMGVDPGLTGAVTTIQYDTMTVLETDDMPVLVNQICPYLLTEIIYRHSRTHNIAKYVIEDVHSMPKQGVVSTFKFERSKGVIEGVLAGLHKRISYVAPVTWKKHLELTKKHKEASRTLATKVFRTDEHWPLKKHNGRAEAALIAYHEGKIRYEKESTQCHKA